ncbi:hypothetical protein TNCV_3863811 [Trichonephila clavipes]|nr:hypothetical protein TNCV_3863811 [Trichonephila clavipes]
MYTNDQTGHSKGCGYAIHTEAYAIPRKTRLAFAMTINKSQGQSFEKDGLHITSKETIFTKRQLYVAVSRCRSKEGTKIQCNLEEKVIRNIVFEEA